MVNEARAEESVYGFPAGMAARGQEAFSTSNREFAILTVPNTLSAMSVPLVGLISTMVIGSLGDANLIGGVAISGALFSIVFFAFNFLRSGTLGLTAHAFGAGDVREQAIIAIRSMLVAALCGVVVIAAQVPLSWIGFNLMGASGQVLLAGLSYFLVRIWAAPLTLMNFSVIGWVMGRSQAITGLVLQLASNGLNIVLSILFVTVFHLGVVGVALAVVISELFTTLVGVLLMAQVITRAGDITVRQVFDAQAFLRMLQINADIFIRSLFLFISLAIFTRNGALFGAYVLACNAILFNIFQTCSAALDGVSAAAEQLTGRALGARSSTGLATVIRLALIWGCAFAIVIGSSIYMGLDTIVAWTTSSPEIRELATHYGIWVTLSVLAATVAYQMDGIFVGATWSRSMRNIMIISATAFAGASLFLSQHFGNHGLWASFVLFLTLRSALYSFRLQSLMKTAAVS